MRPCLGYSNISWVTQEKMKMRREAAKKIPKETLSDPEPISHPSINVEKEEAVVVKEEAVAVKEEVSDESKKQKNSEKREILKRSESKESLKENKSTILERDV